MKVSAHITEDYGEYAKYSSWAKLFSPFAQLRPFCISKKTESNNVNIITHGKDLWQSQKLEYLIDEKFVCQ